MYKLRPNPASGELWPADERLTDPQWAPGSVAGEAVARVTRSPFPSAPPQGMVPTDGSPRAMISRKLEDLLIREAHLRMSRAELVPALVAQEAVEKTVVEARPRWLSFHAKETRVAYESRLAEVRETAQMLRDGIAQLNRVEPHIRRMLRDEVEDLLRTRCPEYVQALAARDQKEDWRRCLNRFAQRMHDFLQALGSARNMACTAYTRDRQVFSPAAVQGFALASECAKQVEVEVQFANRIADLQRAMFRESGLEAAALPRLPTTAFSRTVATIASVPLTEAQLRFDTIIAEVRALYETSVPEMITQAEAAETGHGSLIDNFLHLAWEQLREEVAPLVRPEEMEASVASTERMLTEHAKRTVHGRLKQSLGTRPPVGRR
jgi:hypothetical protein